jgi:hypothetical protein
MGKSERVKEQKSLQTAGRAAGNYVQLQYCGLPYESLVISNNVF